MREEGQRERARMIEHLMWKDYARLYGVRYDHVRDLYDLKRLRQGFGLTQQAFAEFCGVDRKTVMDIENGKREPHSKTKHRIMGAVAELQKAQRDARKLGKAKELMVAGARQGNEKGRRD